MDEGGDLAPPPLMSPRTVNEARWLLPRRPCENERRERRKSASIEAERVKVVDVGLQLCYRVFRAWQSHLELSDTSACSLVASPRNVAPLLWPRARSCCRVPEEIPGGLIRG